MVDIPMAKTLSVLDGGHSFTVDRLALAPGGFTLHYTVTPPLPETLPGGGMLLIYVTATDDQGNTYDDGGGAFGTTPDGTHTDGSITLQPALPADAGAVTVDLVLSDSPTREPHHRFTVDLR